MEIKKVINKILNNKSIDNIKKESYELFAPINIALIKYWGKRDDTLMLPYNSSLSLTINDFGTKTKIALSNKNEDEIFFNKKLISNNDNFAIKIISFLNLFRNYYNNKKLFFKIDTTNNISTGVGYASSASGFAAITLALNDLFQWNLNKKELSILARLGSGSASRSIYNDKNHSCVIWHKGILKDGMDSFAEEIVFPIKNLSIELLSVSNEEKKISSRDAMKISVKTSPMYDFWIKTSEKNLKDILLSINNNDFTKFGETIEENAMLMHSTIMMSNPHINYLLPKTLEHMKEIQKMRKKGIKESYFTIDAGANLIVLSKF